MGRRWAAWVILVAGLAAVLATAAQGPHRTAAGSSPPTGGYYCIEDHNPSDPYSCAQTRQSETYCIVNTTTEIPAPTLTDPCHTIPKR